jgi:hypothetical protein
MTAQFKAYATRRTIRSAQWERLDVVDLSSADSFPASDSPPWTSGPAERPGQSDRPDVDRDR